MIGRTLGSYKIVSQLGAGGMGVVYVAEHPLIGRKAAVKLLLPEYSNNKNLVERFFNEARAATVVKHRGIVDIFDFGYTEDNRAFIVMEFLEGESLADRIKRGRLAIDEATRIARQVASALSAAHEAGIIHRDLKPDNVFLIHDSEVAGGERIKVLDFGIAKLSKHRDPGASKTQTGQLMGSPLYMAPEQCKGAASVDARADVYSLGCVMYEMISARPIFDGNAAGEIIAKQIYESPDPPSAFVSGIPSAIEAVIMRCLEKEPATRFASMREVIDALDLATKGKHAVAAGKQKAYVEDAVAETVAPSGPEHLLATPVPTPLPGSVHTPATTPVPGAAYPSAVGPQHASSPVQTTLGTAASEMTGGSFAEKRSGGRGWAFGAAAVSVLVVAAGIFFLVKGGTSADSGPGVADDPADPVGSEVASNIPDPAPQPPPPALDPADAGSELPAKVKIEILTDPKGAAIYRVSDGVRIGKTPFSRTFDRSEGALDLLLKHRDCRSYPLVVPLTEDRSFDLTLDRKRTSGSHSAHRPAVKPEPKKPPVKPAEKQPEPKKTDKELRKEKAWGKTYNPLDE